ncbi:MAG: BACON domain-containing protein [Verrucomicrobiota bacterium]
MSTQRFLGIALVFIAFNLEAAYTPEVVSTELSQTYPYNVTGLLSATEAGKIGSGAVIRYPKVVISCAHVVYDFGWKNGNYFFPAWNLGSFPSRSQGVLLRSYWHFTSYSSGTSDRDFDRDFVAHYAYENIAEGRYGRALEDGREGLRSTLPKLITGYPGGLYPSGSPFENRLHQTGPFSLPFIPSSYSTYLTINEVSTGAGNSGGPTWVNNSNDWAFAGVLVAGLERSENDGIDRAGVRAIEAAAWDLVDKAYVSAGGCSNYLKTASATFGSTASTGTFDVTSTGGCTWAAIPDQNWIHTTNTADGNGVVNFFIDANHSGTPRKGSISVGNRSFQITQDFPQIAGSYKGFFHDVNNTKLSSSGFLSAKVTSSGAFSARIQLEGKSYALTGVFSREGSATGVILRKNLPSLEVNLQVDAFYEIIIGDLDGGLWSANLDVVKDGFTSLKRGGKAPKYTMAFLHNSEKVPSGDGIATLIVSPTGVTQIRGAMADGTRFSQKSSVSASSKWPLYIPLYNGKGVLFGWNTFKQDGTITGNLTWIKNEGSRTFYPDGFTNDLQIAGSVYAPVLNQTWGLDFINGLVVLEDGNLPGPLSNLITLDQNSVRADVGAIVDVNLRYALPTGLVKGSFIHPANGKKTLVTGVVLQKQNEVRGFFLGTNQSGSFLLEKKLN